MARKLRKGVIRKKKDFQLPNWIADGSIGVLALMIYNFGLYLLKSSGAGGFILEMEKTTGYFCLNSFLEFNFSSKGMITGTILVFAFSFLLGVVIARKVRKYRGYKR
ncbi:MAG: hypothetical protein AABX30_00340 [Nanoarchaeota archaeon]